MHALRAANVVQGEATAAANAVKPAQRDTNDEKWTADHVPAEKVNTPILQTTVIA